jgi:hypothetical protein
MRSLRCWAPPRCSSSWATRWYCALFGRVAFGQLFFDLLLSPLIFMEPRHLAALWAARSGRASEHGEFAADVGSQRAVPSGELRVNGFVLGSVSACTLLLVVGVGRFEGYPLTAWQMYSTTVRVAETHSKNAVCRLSSGVTQRFYPDRYIGALKDGRFRDHYWRAFSDAHRRPLVLLIDHCVAEHNKSAAPQQRIVEVEIQSRRFDFSSGPPTPPRGTLVEAFNVPVR